MFILYINRRVITYNIILILISSYLHIINIFTVSVQSGTQNLIPENDVPSVDDSKDTNDILEIIPKQNNRLAINMYS